MGFDFLDNKQNLLTRALLIMLALTFVIGFGYVGGIDLGGQGTASGTAVEVNGEKVTYAQFKNLKDSLRRQFSQNQGELPQQALDYINYTALNNLVELKLLSQKAKELGLRISDEELAKDITSNPAFQLDGVFVGKENYESFITQRLNQTVGNFEESYKDELLARKLVSIINESAKVTDEELLSLYKMKNEEVKLNYISFTAEGFINSINPNEQEINNYYQENKNSFKTEEKRKIEYLNFGPSNFESAVVVSEEELKAYYSAYTDEFKENDKVKPFEDVKKEIEKKLKETRVEKVYNEFVSGFEVSDVKSLEKLSAENSLGKVAMSEFFSRTDSADIPKNVVDKTYSIEKNDVSIVFDNSTSWIVRLVEIQENKEKEFSEVKEEITIILKKEKAKNAARVSADETLKKVESSNNDLVKTARNLGFTVNETAFFNRTKGPSEINSEDIILESFQLSPENPLLPKVYNSGENFIIASLKEKKPIETNEFEENKFSVKEQEISRQRREILSNWLDKIRSQAKIVPNKNLFPAQG